METVRSVKVTIAVETNKRTDNKALEPFEHESTEEFIKRVVEELQAAIEG